MYLGDLLAGVLGFTTQHQQQPPIGPASSCSNPGLSCPLPVPANPDTCCLNHPSGHFLLTQFWDASPPLGSAENWTIHGLWPDFCTGGFEQFCDSNREHSNIADILASSPDLLSYMQQHWLSLNGDNNHLWAHEWNKHGTCISTLEPDCYPSENDSAEAVMSYFTHAATLYSTLKTYTTLAAADILPSRTETYTLDELQSAVSASHGHPVTFRCHGSELQEIWYHYSVRGPLRHAQPFDNVTSSRSPTRDIFVPTEPDISKSNCPSRGIRYLPKSAGRTPQPTHTTRPTHTSTASSVPTGPARRPFSGRGHLLVRQISTTATARQTLGQQVVSASTERTSPDRNQEQQPLPLHVQPQPQPQQLSNPAAAATKGCLIRGGLWYTSGGCATYLAKTDPPHADSPRSSSSSSSLFSSSQAGQGHMFTLSSLYAPCAVVGGDARFACAKDLGVQTIFESVNVTRLGDVAARDGENMTGNGDNEEDDKDGDATAYDASAGAAAAAATEADLPERERGSSVDYGRETDPDLVTRQVLAYRGRTTFYADRVPGRFEKVEIFADDDGGRREVAVEVEWEAI